MSRGPSERDKATSGIRGLDEITGGGLPRGRFTAVLGGPGSGKTILALQVLVAGAKTGEPGMFVAFEETPSQIVKDAAKFDWHLAGLTKRLELIDAQLSQSILFGGEYDLIGLLAVLGARAKQLGAKRIVFDGLDVLLGHLGSASAVRREVLRLREWLYASRLTGIVTAKADSRDGNVEYDFLEFMADCVIALQHRISDGAAIRVLRVSKRRGEGHSSNEFPFTITSAGVELAASTSSRIDHAVSMQRVSSGVKDIDGMLDGGYYRGSSVLISGAPGTTKTSLSAAFAAAACRRQERTVYVSFDESPQQIVRNVASIGIDLAAPLRSGLLTMCSLRARADNPESHVARIRVLLEKHRAQNLIIDPLSALLHTADLTLSDHAAVQVLDVAKGLGVTCVSTSLLATSSPVLEETAIGVSTIADTWMHVSYVSQGGERNRALTIVKARGMNHSNQVRELVLSRDGITLAAPYLSGGEVLMGTLRWERESLERQAEAVTASEADLSQKKAELALAEIQTRIDAARVERVLREAELQRIITSRRSSREAARLESIERTSRRGGRRAGNRNKSGRSRP